MKGFQNISDDAQKSFTFSRYLGIRNKEKTGGFHPTGHHIKYLPLQQPDGPLPHQ